MVNILLGRTLSTDKRIQGVKLNFGERELEAHLFSIEMRDFYLILGMDWLSSNYATIHCHSRDEAFQKSNEDEFVLHGAKTGGLPRVISMMNSVKIIKKRVVKGF